MRRMEAKVSLTKGLNFAKFFDFYPAKAKTHFKFPKSALGPYFIVALNVKAQQRQFTFIIIII